MADWIIAICAVISLLGTGIAVVFGMINRRLNESTKTIIERELTANHGTSIKDRVNQASQDAADAKKTADEALSLSKKSVEQNNELLTKHDDLRSELDRYIKHQLRNTLLGSNLMKEVDGRSGSST